MSWIEEITALGDKAVSSLGFENQIPKGFFDELKAALAKNRSLQKFDFQEPQITSTPPQLNDETIICEILLAGISGPIYICTPYEFVQKICKTHISEESSVDNEFLNAFTKFLILEAMLSSSNTSLLKKNPPSLRNLKTTKFSELELLDAKCISIGCTFAEMSIPIILIVSKEFQNSWGKLWLNSEFVADVKTNVLSKHKTLISVEAASTSITQEELSSLAPGDWIFLSNSGFDMNLGTAEVSLCISGEDICRGIFDGTKVSVKSIL